MCPSIAEHSYPKTICVLRRLLGLQASDYFDDTDSVHQLADTLAARAFQPEGRGSEQAMARDAQVLPCNIAGLSLMFMEPLKMFIFVCSEADRYLLSWLAVLSIQDTLALKKKTGKCRTANPFR